MPRVATLIGLFTTASAVCSPPEQFFTNFFNSPDELMISWASESVEASVEYGPTVALGMVATGNATKYSFTNTSLKGYTSPYLHHVLLRNLSLETRYFYRVGGTVCGYSYVMNVTTHPGVGAGVVPLRFAMIGDLGQTNNSADTLQHMASRPGGFASIFLFGDLSYAGMRLPSVIVGRVTAA
jgi:acid phosphatase type 7